MIKLKREGNMEENIQKFLITYRTTPNSAVIDEKSPAELFIGRKLGTPLNDLRKMYAKTKLMFEKMDKQFNKKHGSKEKYYDISEPVYAIHYQNNNTRWVPGKIVKKIGKTIYEVNMNKKIYVKHVNQLRRRSSNLTTSPQLTIKDSDKFERIRRRRPPKRLTIDPAKKYYNFC